MDQLIQSEMYPRSAQPGRTDLSEAEAIRRAQAGDVEAFERLYRLHSGRVYALCLRMMRRNTSEAEDLTQEAFLHVFRKIDTFRAESAFSTWLHRVTFNIVLMRLRKDAKAPAEFPLEETNDADEDAAGARKEFGATDLRLSGLVDRVNLQRAVEQLAPGYRSIFVLHDVDGYEHNEIARILGCSISNSKSQLHKARGILRQLLQNGKRTRVYQRRKKAEEKSQPVGEVSFDDQLAHAR